MALWNAEEGRDIGGAEFLVDQCFAEGKDKVVHNTVVYERFSLFCVFDLQLQESLPLQKATDF